MSGAMIAALVLQNWITGLFSMLFRIFGLGAKSKTRALVGLVVFSAASIIFPAMLILQIGYDRYKGIAFLVTLLANASVFIISSDSFLKTCFLHFSQANALFWISTVVGSLRRMFELSYIVSDLIRLILCIVALYLGLKYCVKPLRFMADTIRTGWLGLIAIPGLIIVAGVAIAVYFGLQPSFPELFMIAVVTVLELSFVFYMYGLLHSLRESRQLAEERNHWALLQAEIRAYDDAIAAAKQTRHDLRHHNAVVLEYLHEGEITQAMDYLTAYDTALTGTSLKQYCDNITANAILRMYDRRAKEKQTRFEVQTEIPESLPLNALELSALLSNLLENAAEACEKQSDAPCIHVTAALEATGWRLEVCNTCPRTVTFENGFPKSSKPMGGTGTRSIAAIVEHHGGILRFFQKEERFVAQIFLPVQP